MGNFDGTTNHSTAYKKVQRSKRVEIICKYFSLFVEKFLKISCEVIGCLKVDYSQAKNNNQTSKGGWKSPEKPLLDLRNKQKE